VIHSTPSISTTLKTVFTLGATLASQSNAQPVGQYLSSISLHQTLNLRQLQRTDTCNMTMNEGFECNNIDLQCLESTAEHAVNQCESESELNFPQCATGAMQSIFTHCDSMENFQQSAKQVTLTNVGNIHCDDQLPCKTAAAAFSGCLLGIDEVDNYEKAEQLLNSICRLTEEPTPQPTTIQSVAPSSSPSQESSPEVQDSSTAKTLQTGTGIVLAGLGATVFL